MSGSSSKRGEVVDVLGPLVRPKSTCALVSDTLIVDIGVLIVVVVVVVESV